MATNSVQELFKPPQLNKFTMPEKSSDIKIGSSASVNKVNNSSSVMNSHEVKPDEFKESKQPSCILKLAYESRRAEMMKNFDKYYKSGSASVNKVDNSSSVMNLCGVKPDELRSNAEIKKMHSNINSNSSGTVPTLQDVKPKYLDTIVDLIDEEDLLCEISMKKSDPCSDSDSDENHLSFEVSTGVQEFDANQMVNNKLSLFEKQKIPALQIGLAVPEPVLNVEEAMFSKHVSRVLKGINFYGPSCIQSVAWPAVERGRDIFIVAPRHSGKTVSYVLPLVSGFTSQNATVAETNGPHTIVLCSSWIKAQAVNDCFQLFLGGIKKKIFTLYTTGGHFQNKMQSVINECDILIATPHCLFEFFRKKMISFARLEEFVLDDGSTVMETHKKELKEIVLCIMEAIKKNECCPQLILCTERWNKNFQIIVDKTMRNPLLYFTSFLEAAVYAKIPIFAEVCKSREEKKSALLRIITNDAHKVVVCTTNMAEAVDVHQSLLRACHHSYLINEDLEHFVSDDVIRSWKSANSKSTSQCLIITDRIVMDLNISNADCLVHFDIPSKSRLQFGNRFRAIAEHLTKKKSSSKCVCHILVLESEYNYAGHFIEIIENSGGTPSEKLVELSKMENKDANISGDLCHYMKAFGVCAKRHCKNRHAIVPAIDKPQIVPCEGDIHGIVTHVIDASHYYVRLVKYLDPISNKTVSLVGTYAKIGFQLRDFYLHASEEMKVKTPVVGESYVIEEENKLFYRVKILGFIPESSTNVAQWRVLFLDEGWIKCSKIPKLFKLTDEIDLPKPLAVEVYSCNMVPPDSSCDWNLQTSQLVSDLIKGKEIHGKIVLCIGETLWLDPLAVTVRLSDGNYIYPFKIDQKLLDCGHIVKTKKHIVSLHRACAGKIALPHVTKPKVKEEKEKVDKRQIPLNYAFLECSVDVDVYVSSVVSPDRFYIQRAKFVECLDDLQDKINVQAEKKKLKRAYTFFKDMVCIAPFSDDDRYYRAIIIDLLDDDKVRVFFVDFGDTETVARKDIFSLTSEFLLLPFQAIECQLDGIFAPNGGWTETAINTFTAWTRDEAYDMKILQLVAYSKTSSYSCGNHYVVDLWSNEKKLSKELLQAGICRSAISIEEHTDSILKQISNMDDKNSSSTEDENMEPEDKIITSQFYGIVAKMLAEQYDFFPLPQKPSTEESDEEILKKCNITSLPASNMKCDNFKDSLPKLNQLEKTVPSSKLPSNSLKPLITWWDTPEELNILINLKDIKIYELNIADQSLSFNTIIAGAQYATEENFYEKINSCDAKTYQTAQGVNIVAKKCTLFKWPRLTKEKKKFFHIKYDFVHIEDSDNEENSDEEKSKIKRDMRYFYEDDGSSSDEEETYVEPWREFARYKDPATEFLTEM